MVNIFKSVDALSSANYHPIFLLSSFAETSNKNIGTRITDFLEENRLLRKSVCFSQEALDYSFYGLFFHSEYFGNELKGTLLLFKSFIGLFIVYKYQSP